MFYKDTVAAIATSSKNGSISVIRVSGEESLKCVSKIFYNDKKKNINLTSYETHTIHHGFISAENFAKYFHKNKQNICIKNAKEI